ncbi:hypothetical protein [Cellulosilyticum ruminicola]|uniref:hypothetical protein n=1 Tax=Cellulosilyticum ruminicola TaxID=425254 RepID=UPI0006D10FD3|nr:hypothetical protein [Cellulosilyticum ruminicola]
MKVVPFNRPKSIWEVIDECTTEGILNQPKVEEILNPIEEGEIRISAALVDILYNNEGMEQNECQAKAICNLIEQINEGQLIEYRLIIKKLKQIKIRALGLIGILEKHLSKECMTKEIYELFKKILFDTTDKELFKLAIQVTCLGKWCEELLPNYEIIGQGEEFSRYIAYAFNKWIAQKPFREAAFRVLDLSVDWGAVYFTEALLQQKELLKNKQYQREILIGGLRHNSIQMEISIELATTLDLPQLFKMSLEDYELCRYLIMLYNSLLYDTIPDGGICEALENSLVFIERYLEYLEIIPFDILKLLGIKDVLEFIKNSENKELIIETYDGETYEHLKAHALTLWKETYTLELVRKSLKEGVSCYAWCRFIKKYHISELVEDCRALYDEKSMINWLIEDILIDMGDMVTQYHIYQLLKKNVNDKARVNIAYSYINLVKDVFKGESSIINTIKVLEKLPFKDVAEFNMQLLGDYNPQVRSRAINALNGRSEEEIKQQEGLVEKIVERLGDGPFYIRNDALQLCKNKNIKISKVQAKAIEMNWQKRTDGNSDEFIDTFMSIQERPISIVPVSKKINM